MGRVLSQTTLEKLKKEMLRHFYKFLLNLNTDSCEGVCSVLCKGSQQILERRSIGYVVGEIVGNGYNPETRNKSADEKDQEEDLLEITVEIFSAMIVQVESLKVWTN